MRRGGEPGPVGHDLPAEEDAKHSAAVTLLLCLALPECAEGPVGPVIGAEEEEIKAVLAGQAHRRWFRQLQSNTGRAVRW